MTHRMASHVSVWTMDLLRRMSENRGQGTVEYVGVVVTMALLLGAVAVAAKGWGGDIGGSLKGVVKDALGFTGDRLTGKK